MNCPACSSDQWKLASVVYEEGAGSTSNTVAGIGTIFDIFKTVQWKHCYSRLQALRLPHRISDFIQLSSN